MLKNPGNKFELAEDQAVPENKFNEQSAAPADPVLRDANPEEMAAAMRAALVVRPAAGPELRSIVLI